MLDCNNNNNFNTREAQIPVDSCVGRGGALMGSWVEGTQPASAAAGLLRHPSLALPPAGRVSEAQVSAARAAASLTALAAPAPPAAVGPPRVLP